MGADFWIMLLVIAVAASSIEGLRYWLLSRAIRLDSIARRRWELRSKLHFAVSTSRNGGYWMERGEARQRYRTNRDGPLIEVYKTAYRWQSA